MKHLLTKQITESFPGIRKKTVKVLKTYNPELLTVYTVEALQSWVTSPAMMTSVACRLGKAIVGTQPTPGEDERTTKLRWFEIGYHLLIQACEIGVIKLSLEKPDTKARKIKIRKGKLVSRNPRKSYIIVVKDQTKFDELIASVDLVSFNNQIHTQPQLTEPEDWTSIYHPVAGDLIRNSNRQQRRWMNRAKNNRLILNAVNKHQKIAYLINQDVLDIVKCSLSDEILDLPSSKYSKEQQDSNKVMVQTILKIADEIGNGLFWQYHYLDNRGRLYASTNYLNHGGSKLAKALFYSADSERIGTDGLFWLKYQAANTYGYDKVSISERVDFIDERLDEILGMDFYTDKSWQEADDPFGYLAACIELQKAYQLDDPTDWVSGLLVAFDASCSGLQLLAALTKDEVVGDLCNLTGTDYKGDFYTFISEEWLKECKYTSEEFISFQAIQAHIKTLNKGQLFSYYQENFEEIRAVAHVFWSSYSAMGRKLTKRSAMTYLYSCGSDTMGEHIWNDFAPELEGVNEIYCNWLGHQIYDACVRLMVGPTKMMKLFVKWAKEEYAKGYQFGVQGHYNGMFMMQNYTVDKTEQIQVSYKGKQIKPRVIVQKGYEMDKIRIKNGAAPNVVHLMDSQIPFYLINNCEYNITSIHDSFSTIPSKAGWLFEDTRAAFVELFDGDPMLEIFGVEDFEYGTLDVSKVYDDEFCFA